MHFKCWQCGKRLVKSNTTMELVFETVHDHDGNPLRVHKVCKRNAEIAMGLRRAEPMRDPGPLDVPEKYKE